MLHLKIILTIGNSSR